jgi:hypothetical protein
VAALEAVVERALRAADRRHETSSCSLALSLLWRLFRCVDQLMRAGLEALDQVVELLTQERPHDSAAAHRLARLVG